VGAALFLQPKTGFPNESQLRAKGGGQNVWFGCSRTTHAHWKDGGAEYTATASSTPLYRQ